MLIRKLSLERTWKKCLRMWKEMIEKHWERGMKGSDLKRIYFEIHPKIAEPESGCYFCDYNDRRTNNCEHCPGVLVNKKFHCHNTPYHYHWKPKAFYRKLLELDKKRKSGK